MPRDAQLHTSMKSTEYMMMQVLVGGVVVGLFGIVFGS